MGRAEDTTSTLRLGIGCLLVAFVLRWWNGGERCAAVDGCATIGTPLQVSIRGFDRSIGGLAHLDSAFAVLELADTRGRLRLRAFAFDNETWGRTIERVRLEVKGVALTAIEQPLVLHVGTDIPARRDLVGRTGTIRYTLHATYPVLDSAEDRVLDAVINNMPIVGRARDLAPGPTFSNAKKRFSHVYRVQLIAPSILSFTMRPIYFWGPLVLGLLLLLAAWGNTLPENDHPQA